MRSPARATVIGTGFMAPGISAALAMAGVRVTIAGRTQVKAGRAADEAVARTTGDPATIGSAAISPAAFRETDLIVETIVEDLDEKLGLLARIDPWLEPECIVASNTSSLPLDVLAAGTSRPERMAGLHFLNPAELTTVVEVVAASETAADVLDTLRRLAVSMGKQPVDVHRPIPGFVWNRIQFAVLRECAYLLAAGVTDAASIDAAVADGLAPRWTAAGPLATADLGGQERSA